MIHPTCQIDPTARIHCDDITIGPRSIIKANTLIEGKRIVIGTEAYINEYAHIGGGSCFDETSTLVVGDWLHMGVYSHLNQGMGLSIGHEFGCGIGTKVFTHGAYESVYDGFPVQWGKVIIGDRVWMPNAWVNPGVTIGNNIVVAAGSVINRDLPSGCMAGGIPAKVLKENIYPITNLDEEQRLDILSKICDQIGLDYYTIGPDSIHVDKTDFFIKEREIYGCVTEATERLKNQLRRNGIRFRYYNCDGVYKPWE